MIKSRLHLAELDAQFQWKLLEKLEIEDFVLFQIEAERIMTASI